MNWFKKIMAERVAAEEWFNKGYALHKQRRFDEAIECYDKALDIEPEYAGAWENKGSALYKQGRFDEAIECYDRALDIEPEDASPWGNKGVALTEQEKFDEAIVCYNKALDINLKYSGAWNNKGIALMQQDKFDEAIECYNKALDINPEYTDPWNYKGVALTKQDKFDEAIECYNKALDINPEYTGAWNNKGIALKKQERFDEAIECYNKALQNDPKDADAWNNKGVALLVQGKYDEAIECYDKALDIDPEYTDAWRDKGSALRKLGKYDKATICEDKAHELDSKSVTESTVEDDLCLDLSISRETEFYQGFIRFKMSVTNTSSYVVTDVALDFDFDDDILRIDRHDPPRQVKNGKIILGNITASTSKTIAVYFDPMMCSKGADINCLINYKDAKGQIQIAQMGAKKISVVCPIMETDSDINIGRLKEFIEKLPNHDSKVYQIQIGFDIEKLKNSCREVIQKHDVKHIRTLSTKDGTICELWYYGKTKVNSYDIVIRITLASETGSIELFAATQTAESLTGLLAEIGRELKGAVEDGVTGNVQQVINVSIKDSIVQRSNLLSFCDINGNCTGDVVIEDSIVKRSAIGNIKLNNENNEDAKEMSENNVHNYLVNVVKNGSNIEDIKVEYKQVLTHFERDVKAMPLLFTLLDKICKNNHQKSQPFLAAIVVNQESHISGKGFFEKWMRPSYRSYTGLFEGPEAQKIHEEELKQVFNYWHVGDANSCPACGKAMADGAKFCMECGGRL